MRALLFFLNVLRFFFSFRGRFSPLQFWAGQLCALLLLFATIFGTQEIHRIQTGKNALPVDGDPLEPYFWSLVITAAVISLAAVSKRLHDRSVPGRATPGIIFLGLLIPGYVFVWAMDWGFSYWEAGGAIKLIKFIGASLATFAALLYIIIQLGFQGPPEPEPPDPDDWGEDDENAEPERLPVN